jgi:hypothetical protein
MNFIDLGECSNFKFICRLSGVTALKDLIEFIKPAHHIYMTIQDSMRSTIGRLLAVAAIFLVVQGVHAQTLFSEAFNYTTGQNLGGRVNPGNSVTWTGGNAVLQIGSADLTYSGLTDQGGEDLVYTTGASASTSVNTYSAVTSGSIYYSFLIDCTTLPTANTYITSLNPGTTGPGGSGDAMATYVGPTTGGWKIGVRNGNGGAAYTTVLTLGTTYFVAEELTLGSTPTVSLFLDPTAGASQPTATATQTGTVAVSSVADVGIKAQTTATGPGAYLIDNLLIGTTWASITPGAVPEPSSLALTGLGLAGLVGCFRRQRR